MLKISLQDIMVDAILKKIFARFLSKKLGKTATVSVKELIIDDSGDNLKMRVNMDVDMDKKNAYTLIMKMI